jgi:hypothetical protein
MMVSAHRVPVERGERCEHRPAGCGHRRVSGNQLGNLSGNQSGNQSAGATVTASKTVRRLTCTGFPLFVRIGTSTGGAS